MIGPVYSGRDLRRRRSTTGTGSPRRWRRAESTASSTTSTATRGSTRPGASSVLRFTRERMLLHRHPEALVEALRQVPRSRPFESMDELERLECRRWSSPATTTPTPAIPTRSAAAYAERLPQARLVSEGEGESPLAWQGGRLSREIAAFCRRRHYLHRYEVPERSDCCAGSSPSSRPSGSASRPTSRSPIRAAARRPAWPAGAAARRSPTAPTRTSPASTSPSSGSSATCALLLTAFFVSDLARFGGFAVALGGFGFSVYLTYLELLKIEAICQWCVASAVLMTILFVLNATRLIGYAGTTSAAGRSRPSGD